MGQFIVGIFLGVFLGVLGLTLVVDNTNSYHNIARSAIAECEKKLPRDQTCRVIGVPKEIK